MYVINGLSNDLKDITIVVHTFETSILFKELYEKLIEHAVFFKWTIIDSSDSVVIANMAKRFPSFNSRRGFSPNNSQSSSFGSFNSNSGKQSNSCPTGQCKGKCSC